MQMERAAEPRFRWFYRLLTSFIYDRWSLFPDTTLSHHKLHRTIAISLARIEHVHLDGVYTPWNIFNAYYKSHLYFEMTFAGNEVLFIVARSLKRAEQKECRTGDRTGHTAESPPVTTVHVISVCSRYLNRLELKYKRLGVNLVSQSTRNDNVPP